MLVSCLPLQLPYAVARNLVLAETLQFLALLVHLDQA